MTLMLTEGSELSTYLVPEQLDSSDSDKEASLEISQTGILPETYSVKSIVKDLKTFQLSPVSGG